MFLRYLNAFIFSAVVLSGSASAAAITKRDDTFQLYAYGGDIGGYPVKYKDGLAYAVSPDVDTTSGGFVDIAFSFNGSNTLVVTPTNSSQSSNQTLTLGFTAVQSSNTSLAHRSSSETYLFEDADWVFYGNTLLKKNSNGQLVSQFYGSAGSSGVASLLWATSSDAAGTGSALALRRVAPST